MRLRRLAAIISAFALAAPTVASAQKTDPDEPLEGSVQRQEGDYGGVKPGQPPRAHEGKQVKRPRNGTLSWIGFAAESGAGRLFLQAPSEFQYTQHVEGKQLVVHLTGVKSLARNVRRPLDTRFFDSPVSRVTVKKVKKRRAGKGLPARKAGVEIRISFKDPLTVGEAASRTAVEADGYFYLYLDFGAVSPAIPEE